MGKEIPARKNLWWRKNVQKLYFQYISKCVYYQNRLKVPYLEYNRKNLGLKLCFPAYKDVQIPKPDSQKPPDWFQPFYYCLLKCHLALSLALSLFTPSPFPPWNAIPPLFLIHMNPACTVNFPTPLIYWTLVSPAILSCLLIISWTTIETPCIISLCIPNSTKCTWSLLVNISKMPQC